MQNSKTVVKNEETDIFLPPEHLFVNRIIHLTECFVKAFLNFILNFPVSYKQDFDIHN